MLPNEENLIAEARQNPQQFGVLYDHYYPKIFGYAYRRLGDYDIARDITAETFLKAFINLHKFQWQGFSISSWFFRIATNELNQYFRKQHYEPILLSEINTELYFQKELHQIFEAEKKALEQQAQSNTRFIQIQQELKKIDQKYQEVIALRYFEEMSIKEIAEILNKNEGTVKSLLSRGSEYLRKRCNQNQGNAL